MDEQDFLPVPAPGPAPIDPANRLLIRLEHIDMVLESVEARLVCVESQIHHLIERLREQSH